MVYDGIWYKCNNLHIGIDFLAWEDILNKNEICSITFFGLCLGQQRKQLLRW